MRDKAKNQESGVSQKDTVFKEIQEIMVTYPQAERLNVGRMTKGCLSVLKRALQDIIELPQPDGHDCDDDEVIELLADLIEKEEEKEELNG